MKECSNCFKVKSLNQFNKDSQKTSGYYSSCKKCCSKKYKKWYSKKESKTLCKNLSSEWRTKNKEKKKEMDKKYRKDNRQKINKYFRDKYHNDESYRLIHNLRNRHKDFISGRRPGYGTKELLGCDAEVMKMWLDFTQEDHIDKPVYDHIIPCEFFNKLGWKDDYQKVCFHWTNIRVCENVDNISKGDNIDLQLIKKYEHLALEFIDYVNNLDINIQISVLTTRPKDLWGQE